MKVVQLDYKSINPCDKPIALCLGYFDGVHLGHINIINEARKKSELPIGILTFDRPVSSLIDNHKSKEVLTSLDDRFRIISRYSLDYYFVLHIDKDFVSLEKEDFIEILKKLNVKEIYVGEDYRFAKNRSGNITYLKQHFKVFEVPLLNIDNKKISTQDIIEYIKNGDIEKANDLLGHDYQIMGVVVKGHQLGTSLGFPTANIKLSDNYVIPKYGVYKTIAYISGVPHLSLTNVGVHPTVNKEDKPTIEVHIPSYKSDDYNKTIYLEFLSFVREEKKFSSTEELQKQIKEDLKNINQ